MISATPPDVPAPAQFARFRAHVGRDARFYAACRDRGGDRVLWLRLYAMRRDVDRPREAWALMLYLAEVFRPLAPLKRREPEGNN